MKGVIDYTPDYWVIIKILGPSNQPVYKLLCGWVGEFGSDDTWKFSSGIVKIIDNHDYWSMLQTSGNLYHCRKIKEDFCGVTLEMYYRIQVEASGTPFTFEAVNLIDSGLEIVGNAREEDYSE